MNRPGTRLRAPASHLFDRLTMERLIDPLPLAFYFNARLAIALAPVSLSVLALAAATATRRGLSTAIVFVTLTVFVGCVVLFPAGDIAVLTHWLPAAAIAWLPNALVMIATLPLAASQRSG